MLEALHLWTGRPVYRLMFEFGLKISVRVRARRRLRDRHGIPVRHELERPGSNVRPIQGPLLSYETFTAFFLKASYFGILLFGRPRVPPWFYLFSTAMVAFGTTLSAYWIMANNSWMQVPTGSNGERYVRSGRLVQNHVQSGALGAVPAYAACVVHPDCVAAYEDASALLASLGHEVVDMDAAPFGPEVVPAFETLWYAMATLAPLEPAQEEVLRPLTRYLRERGRATSAADLVFAQAFLQIVVRGAWPVLNDYDVVLTPTLAQPPAPVGYFEEVGPAENFERQKRFTPFTAVYNVTGQPAVNLPLYWTADGLPIGVMLAARMCDEATLLSLSAQVEAARPSEGPAPSALVRRRGRPGY